MKNKKTIIAAALILAAGWSNAALTPDEIKQLGTTLTPWGAIKAGNKEGTIPAYEGGLPVAPPKSYPQGYDKYHLPDPFADEKPLFSITAKNMDQYADKLNDATKELLKRFPEFRMDIYPSHRVVNYPQYYIDETFKNATNCTTIQEGQAIKGCKGGIPFPIPKTGYEALFNAQYAFNRDLNVQFGAVYVDANGTPVVAGNSNTTSKFPYNDPKVSIEEFYANQAPMSMSTTEYAYPPRIAGDENMTIFVGDSKDHPNRGFRYQQGVRRVRVLPETGYDFPIITSGGAQFYDESSMVLGKLDRFDFKLLGKKEMFIPYNPYKFNNSPPAVFTAKGKFPNPDVMRWELHRVWVVEGTLKPGQRHAYSKRRYYMDEDHYKMGMSEGWDQAGKIFKAVYMLTQWQYDNPNTWNFSNIALNLATGVWYVAAPYAGFRGFETLPESLPWSYYTPEAIMRRSQR